MIPYAIEAGDITQSDALLLKQATVWFEHLPNGPTQHSCHTVCQLWVEQGHPGTHKTGKWARVAEHSWIEVRPGVVLDLYPVAGIRPSLHVRLPIGDPYDDTWRRA